MLLGMLVRGLMEAVQISATTPRVVLAFNEELLMQEKISKMNLELLSVDWLACLSSSVLTGDLFDCLDGLAFFVKNHRGEYIMVNSTLVERCGRRSKSEVIGRRADELFPAPLGTNYRAQDETVLHSGTAILNQLEVHFYATGGRGWCLTNKFPLRDQAGRIVGLVGTSKDLQALGKRYSDYAEISRVVGYIQSHYDEPLTLNELAEMAGLSTFQLGKRFQEIFKITTGQFILKVRIENAIRLLQETNLPIAQVALECGYADQSSFTRQFRITARMTPAECRFAATKKTVAIPSLEFA